MHEWTWTSPMQCTAMHNTHITQTHHSHTHSHNFKIKNGKRRNLYNRKIFEFSSVVACVCVCALDWMAWHQLKNRIYIYIFLWLKIHNIHTLIHSFDEGKERRYECKIHHIAISCILSMYTTNRMHTAKFLCATQYAIR